MSKRLLLLVMATLLCMFVAVGCGSDGSDGKAGQDAVFDETNPKYVELYDKYMDILAQVEGDPDNPGLIAQLEEVTAQLKLQAVANVNQESCAVCHADGKVYAADHAGKYLSTDGMADFENEWSAAISNVSIAADGATTVTFSVTSTGEAFVPANVVTGRSANNVGVTSAGTAGGAVKIFLLNNGRWDILVNTSALTVNGAGPYTVVSPANVDVANAILDTDNVIMVSVMAQSSTDTNASTVYRSALLNSFNVAKIYANGVVGDLDSALNPRNYVSDLSSEPSCTRCHGENEFNYHHNNGTRANAEACVTCHIGSSSGSYQYSGEFGSDGNSALVVRVHGVHSSGELGSNYANYDIHTPTSASDCAVCHTTADQQALIASEDNFYYALCQTCHDADSDPATTAWDTMNFGPTAAAFKQSHIDSYSGAVKDECIVCHGDGKAWAYVRENLHQYLDEDGTTMTLYNESWKYEYVIDDVSVTGRTITVDWYAEKKADSTKVNVLNTVAADGPLFINSTARGSSYALGMKIGYATGDDWTNEGVGNASGQPQSVTIGTSNTVVTATPNVFRTTITIPAGVDIAEVGKKGLIALHGIPKVTDARYGLGYAYVDSITREFLLSNGDVPATLRRETVTFENDCKSCHDHLVGHGHSYVNNVKLCTVCHNPSATEKNSRAAVASSNPTLDASLDGKAEESYDFRYMIHRLHSPSYKEVPYIVYRTRGIYGFNDGTLPAGWGTPVDSTAPWNDVVVHYPRPITECGACHVDGFADDAGFAFAHAKAAPFTVQQGTSLTTQEDDKVLGPTAAACVSCHVDAVGTNQIRSHTATNGYFAQLIPGILTKLGLIQAAEQLSTKLKLI